MRHEQAGGRDDDPVYRVSVKGDLQYRSGPCTRWIVHNAFPFGVCLSDNTGLSWTTFPGDVTGNRVRRTEADVLGAGAGAG